jgi:NAD(P)-dependent dehydrogenase (short-subunit alcohol dehydrogenase family)
VNIAGAWNRFCDDPPVRCCSAKLENRVSRITGTAARSRSHRERSGRRGATVLLLPGDECDNEFCNAAVLATVNTFGWIDILVNNAAFQRHQESIEGLTDEQLERTIRTNIVAYF